MTLFGYREYTELLTSPFYPYGKKLKWRKLVCSMITISENAALMNFQRNES